MSETNDKILYGCVNGSCIDVTNYVDYEGEYYDTPECDGVCKPTVRASHLRTLYQPAAVSGTSGDCSDVAGNGGTRVEGIILSDVNGNPSFVDFILYNGYINDEYYFSISATCNDSTRTNYNVIAFENGGVGYRFPYEEGQWYFIYRFNQSGINSEGTSFCEAYCSFQVGATNNCYYAPSSIRLYDDNGNGQIVCDTYIQPTGWSAILLYTLNNVTQTSPQIEYIIGGGYLWRVPRVSGTHHFKVTWSKPGCQDYILEKEVIVLATNNSAPTDIIVCQNSFNTSTFRLSWTKNAPESLCQVYSSPTINGIYTQYGGELRTETVAQNGNYLASSTHYFKVQRYNNLGVAGPISNPVTWNGSLTCSGSSTCNHEQSVINTYFDNNNKIVCGTHLELDYQATLYYTINGVVQTTPITDYVSGSLLAWEVPKVNGTHYFKVTWSRQGCPDYIIEKELIVGGGNPTGNNTISELDAITFEDVTPTSFKVIFPSTPIGATSMEFSTATENGAFSTPISTTSGAIVERNSLLPNTTYYYKLRAFDINGNQQILIAGVETSNPTSLRVIKGNCAIGETYINNSTIIDVSLNWSISKGLEVISTNHIPDDWTVLLQSDGKSILVCAPSTSVTGTDYQLIYKNNGDNYIIKFYIVDKPVGANFCVPVDLSPSSLIGKTNCSITVKIPVKPTDVLRMRLLWTKDITLPISQWTEVNQDFIGNENYELTNLTELTPYFFLIKAVNGVGSSYGLPFEAVTLANPLTTTPVISLIDSNLVTISNWPQFINCVSKVNVYVKNLSLNTSDSLLLTRLPGECEPNITPLNGSSNYQLWLGVVYPGQKEVLSDKILLTTKTSKPFQPITNLISSNAITFISPLWRTDWKRLDLEIKVGNDWKVVGVALTSNFSMTCNNLLPETDYIFRYVAYGYEGFSTSYTSKIKTSSVAGTGALFPPNLPRNLAFLNVTSTQVSVAIPSKSDATSFDLFYSLTPTSDVIQQVGTNYNGTQTVTVTGLTPNTNYYFTLVAKNAQDNNYNFLNRVKTSCAGVTPDTTIGTPPAPTIQILGFHRLSITAPSSQTWPKNAARLTLEAREKDENSLSPETNLWFVVKTGVTLGEVIIIDNEVLVNNMHYDFRWVATQ